MVTDDMKCVCDTEKANVKPSQETEAPGNLCNACVRKKGSNVCLTDEEKRLKAGKKPKKPLSGEEIDKIARRHVQESTREPIQWEPTKLIRAGCIFPLYMYKGKAFRPTYDKEPQNMWKLISNDYCRQWHKEREAWEDTIYIEEEKPTQRKIQYLLRPHHLRNKEKAQEVRDETERLRIEVQEEKRKRKEACTRWLYGLEKSYYRKDVCVPECKQSEAPQTNEYPGPTVQKYITKQGKTTGTTNAMEGCACDETGETCEEVKK